MRNPENNFHILREILLNQITATVHVTFPWSISWLKVFNKRIRNVVYPAYLQPRTDYFDNNSLQNLFGKVLKMSNNCRKESQTVKVVVSSNIRSHCRSDPLHWWLVENVLLASMVSVVGYQCIIVVPGTSSKIRRNPNMGMFLII